MPNYRRNFVPGGTFFFTVTLLERKRDLLVSQIDLLRDSMRRVKRLYPFEIVAFVVLPDHLHCIWTLPPDDADYPTRWRLIKLLFAKGLPKHERLSSVRQKRGASAACGIAVLGNTPSAMSGIWRIIWTTSTRTRSSMDGSCGLVIGPTRPFIATSASACCPSTG